MNAAPGINERFQSKVADLEQAVRSMDGAARDVHAYGAEVRLMRAEGLTPQPAPHPYDRYITARNEARGILREIGLSLDTVHELSAANTQRLGEIERLYGAAAAGVRACGLIG